MSYAKFYVALYFQNHYSTKPQIENLCLVHILLYRPMVLFLSKILLGLNKLFSIASMKSSKLLHFVSFEWYNLDVIDFFLGGFRIKDLDSSVD